MSEEQLRRSRMVSFVCLLLLQLLIGCRAAPVEAAEAKRAPAKIEKKASAPTGKNEKTPGWHMVQKFHIAGRVESWITTPRVKVQSPAGGLLVARDMKPVLFNPASLKYARFRSIKELTSDRVIASGRQRYSNYKMSPWQKSGTARLAGKELVEFKRHRLNVDRDALYTSSYEEVLDILPCKEMTPEFVPLLFLFCGESPEFKLLAGQYLPISYKGNYTESLIKTKQITHRSLLNYFETTVVERSDITGADLALPPGLKQVSDPSEIIFGGEFSINKQR